MAEVAEFINGPWDGEVVAVAPGPDGLPVEHVRVAVVRDILAVLTDQAEPLLRLDPLFGYPTEPLSETVVYRRDTISDESHRWRYRLT